MSSSANATPEKIWILLVFNLFLQLFDGMISYRFFSVEVAELNPLVNAAMENWGMIAGLFYNKALAAVLLLLIYALRHRRKVMATNALRITASVYTCYASVCLWELWLH